MMADMIYGWFIVYCLYHRIVLLSFIISNIIIESFYAMHFFLAVDSNGVGTTWRPS